MQERLCNLKVFFSHASGQNAALPRERSMLSLHQHPFRQVHCAWNLMIRTWLAIVQPGAASPQTKLRQTTLRGGHSLLAVLETDVILRADLFVFMNSVNIKIYVR